MRPGVTLIELVIVLTLLGFTATVAGLAMLHEPRWRAEEDATRARLAVLRRTAIDSGHAVTAEVHVGRTPRAATAFPDGSVVADTALALDRLFGVADSRRQTSSHRDGP